jgi:hypothetical protein
MADPWDAFLRFNAAGEIEVVDRNPALKIQQQLDAGKKKIKMFYWSNTIPTQKVDALCVCRSTGKP